METLYSTITHQLRVLPQSPPISLVEALSKTFQFIQLNYQCPFTPSDKSHVKDEADLRIEIVNQDRLAGRAGWQAGRQGRLVGREGGRQAGLGLALLGWVLGRLGRQGKARAGWGSAGYWAGRADRAGRQGRLAGRQAGQAGMGRSVGKGR
ncbi:hypothetical protein BY996DRAFT_6489000 [Phakopsora pachyrhizi]|nr:hypothetical protein BY996DRAFT_6489000 [Phakopsora pachyrhizi]